MKWGEQLENLRLEAWSPFYLPYSTLKSLLKCSPTDGMSLEEFHCKLDLTFFDLFEASLDMSERFYLFQKAKSSRLLERAKLSFVDLYQSKGTTKDVRREHLRSILKMATEISTLLDLVQAFSEVNAVSVRKILKKMDKVTNRHKCDEILLRAKTCRRVLSVEDLASLRTDLETFRSYIENENLLYR